jgi:hypothetical protein
MFFFWGASIDDGAGLDPNGPAGQYYSTSIKLQEFTCVRSFAVAKILFAAATENLFSRQLVLDAPFLAHHSVCRGAGQEELSTYFPL